jgi:hypothetical protein
MILRDKHGKYCDKMGNRVNKFGYRTDDLGNIIDKNGLVKIPKELLTVQGDIPKLFSYGAKRFSLSDLLGIIEKEYLVDEEGNVVDNAGKIIFEKKYLTNGEIPKVYPFSKLNLKDILGDFDMDPLGNPVLDKNEHG